MRIEILKTEINKNPRKNKCRVDKLNFRSSHGIFEGCIVYNENKRRTMKEVNEKMNLSKYIILQINVSELRSC